MPDEAGELGRRHALRRLRGAWKPKRATLLAVRAFSEENGKRKAVSHMAKAVRGEVARALLLAKKRAEGPGAAAADRLTRRLRGRADAGQPRRDRRGLTPECTDAPGGSSSAG